jgi:hypothetical protein
MVRAAVRGASPDGDVDAWRRRHVVLDVLAIDVRPTIADMASRVPPTSVDEPHEGAARLTGEQVIAIDRFPDDPNPVMWIDAVGHLIYANPASAGVLSALAVAVGDPIPEDVLASFEAVAPEHGFLEFVRRVSDPAGATASTGDPGTHRQ